MVGKLPIQRIAMETVVNIQIMGPLLVVGMSDNSIRVFNYTPRDPHKLVESNQNGAVYRIPENSGCSSPTKITGIDGHLLIQLCQRDVLVV